MEVFSKGIHRALVPLGSHMQNIAGVELVESAPSYQMLTQVDLLRFLKAHDSELKGIMSHNVEELGAVTKSVFGVTNRTKVIEAIKCMRAASLSAVPIVEASSAIEEDHGQLVNPELDRNYAYILQGKGRKLVGTFSATDLRGCPISQLQFWLPLSVLDFKEKHSTSPLPAASDTAVSSRELVTCHAESCLAEAIEKALTKHVHRIWVIDHLGHLVGVVALTDIIRVMRVSLLS
ncbi:unnamed protein product [Ilex paraguariensis]|uniref:CBS domain-containing protein n=1 Tax=Ilex paraguariensis TaxID=185542 RepID=A0ABC8UX29_9AQUA